MNHEDGGETMSFLRELISMHSKSVFMAGSALAERASTQIEKAQNNVLDARFAMGADDGAYLRSNVMPLQTSDPECDATHLAGQLSVDMEAAGRMGLYREVLKKLEDDVVAQRESVRVALELCAWLLSIKEVREFAKLRMQREIDDGSLDASAKNAHEAAYNLVSAFEQNILQAKTGIMEARSKLAVATVLVETVFHLYGAPMDHVEEQWQTTVVEQMSDLGGALQRLAQAASVTPAVYAANNTIPDVAKYMTGGTEAQAAGGGWYVETRSSASAGCETVRFKPQHSGFDGRDHAMEFGGTADEAVAEALKQEIKTLKKPRHEEQNP